MKLTEIYKEVVKEAVEPIFEDNQDGQNCDCCKYFDFNSLKEYDGYRNPIYYMLSKNKSEELKYIKPKQYIHSIAMGFGGLSYEDAIAHVNWNQIKAYATLMKQGEKFPIGFYSQGKGGQEGRHRALALIEIGCDIMPIIVRKDVSYEDAKNFVLKYKDYSREQLDQLFKDKGYKGISDLDYGEFNRFKTYRLNND